MDGGNSGHVGGGLRMNAGAMGAQTFENVTRVRYLDAEGNSHVKNRNELEVFYRRFPLLEKTLQFLQRSAGNQPSAAEIDARLRESQEKRRTTQPPPKAQAAFSKILPPFQPANWWTN
jgi:UDP-N-acetylmuramate dehydrogenase